MGIEKNASQKNALAHGMVLMYNSSRKIPSEVEHKILASLRLKSGKEYETMGTQFERIYRPLIVTMANAKTAKKGLLFTSTQPPIFKEKTNGLFLLVDLLGDYYLLPRFGNTEREQGQIEACFTPVKIQPSQEEQTYQIKNVLQAAACKSRNGDWILSQKGEIEVKKANNLS